MDAWGLWELEMEKRRLETHYETQQKILELQKSMWDKGNVVKDDKINSAKSDMLTIQNLHKIIGKKIHIVNPNIKEGTIEDVIDKFGGDGCSYIFKVQVYEPQNPNLMGIGMYDIKLDRKRIEYSRQLNHCWELSYEEEPNQFIVEAMDKRMVGDMNHFREKLGGMMDRILNK
jgi:hypothetical protein